MHRYSLHIGDYAAHTRHLSPIEDLAYRRMLDAYYLHEKPLSGDVAAISRAIGLPGHDAEVGAVLAEFFVKEADQWRNARCDREILEYRDVVRRNQENGRRGGRPRNPLATKSVASGMPVETDREPTVLKPTGKPPSSLLPSPSSQGTEQRRAERAVQVESWPGVEPEILKQFLAFRRRKAAPVTELVMRTTEKKAAEAGLSMNDALIEWIANGTTGFFQKPVSSSRSGKPDMRERFKHLEPGQPNPWGDGPTVRNL